MKDYKVVFGERSNSLRTEGSKEYGCDTSNVLFYDSFNECVNFIVNYIAGKKFECLEPYPEENVIYKTGEIIRCGNSKRQISINNICYGWNFNIYYDFWVYQRNESGKYKIIEFSEEEINSIFAQIDTIPYKEDLSDELYNYTMTSGLYITAKTKGTMSGWDPILGKICTNINLRDELNDKKFLFNMIKDGVEKHEKAFKEEESYYVFLSEDLWGEFIPDVLDENGDVISGVDYTNTLVKAPNLLATFKVHNNKIIISTYISCTDYNNLLEILETTEPQYV